MMKVSEGIIGGLFFMWFLIIIWKLIFLINNNIFNKEGDVFYEQKI